MATKFPLTLLAAEIGHGFVYRLVNQRQLFALVVHADPENARPAVAGERTEGGTGKREPGKSRARGLDRSGQSGNTLGFDFAQEAERQVEIFRTRPTGGCIGQTIAAFRLRPFNSLFDEGWD